MRFNDVLLLCAESKPAPAPIRPSKEQILDVKANMISMRDATGTVMLSWFWPLLSPEQQADWESRWRAAGLTHVVMCPVMQYPGYPLAADWRTEPDRFAGAVTGLLGRGFIPVIQMTSGDGGTGQDVDIFWPGLLGALSPVLPYVMLSCGFEVVGPGGGWRSAELSRGLITLHNVQPGAIGVHLQPERATGASYGGSGTQAQTPPGYVWHDYQDPTQPGIGAFIEDDDPWQGDEAGFWKAHGGQFADCLLYQTPHGRKLLDVDAQGVGGWEDRWIEIIDRLGIGAKGWRKVALCLFEKTGYDYWHGHATDADVVRTSNRGRDLCTARGVTCSFGDGLPG